MRISMRLSPTGLPPLTAENLDAVMAERLAATRNENTAIPMLWQGLLEMTLDAGRTLKLYVPKDTPQGSAFALLNIPAGVDSVSFLEESGWLACADRFGLPLCAAEPGPGGWRSPAEEQGYIEDCVRALFAGVYLRAGMSIYVVGYGEIGKCLHRYVLDTPLRIAAAVFLDASGLDETAIETAEAARLDFDAFRFDLMKREIPVPVWIVEKQESARAARAAAHWRSAIGAGEGTQDPVFGTVYAQTRESVCTPDGPIAKVCVRYGAEDCTAPEMTGTICGFLRRYARYNKFGPYGNSLVPYADYAALGVEVRHFPDADGMPRECLVYVPKAFRGKGKLPLVFAIHGSSESVRNYFEESLLYRLADREGFIVVMPETKLYPMPDELSGGAALAWRPRWEFCSMFPTDEAPVEKDLRFFENVFSSACAAYPVDETRIYGTGHSNGFMMMSLLASSPLGKHFAAVAMTSGVTSAWDQSGTDAIPVWMTMGEYDIWPYDLREENGLTIGLDRWLVRNGLADEASAKEKRISGADESYVDRRHHVSVWKDAEGTPMLRYDWIEMKDHMNTPDENLRFWDEWFSHWRLDSHGVRRYE